MISVNDKFYTIDDMVDSYVKANDYYDDHPHVYSYIVNCKTSQLLLILLSKYNKPSIHDIYIINSITRVAASDFCTPEFRDCYKLLLTAYKDRKINITT